MKHIAARLLVLGLSFPADHAAAQVTETTRPDGRLAKGLPIKCSGTDYTWAAMLRATETTHTRRTMKAVNSEPLEVVVLETNGSLMVDNEAFRIVRSNSAETFAVFLDEMNAITVVLNYRYGTMLYSKVFTNVDIGKQNAMSFVAPCKNY